MKAVIKDILMYGIMMGVLAIAYIFIINNHTYLSPVQEKASIGGIEIGTDSLVAVRNIQKRFYNIRKTNIEVPTVWQRGDSVGYDYPYFNETFYVKINGGKVYEIYFHSDSLTDKEVDIASKQTKYGKYQLIYHKGEKFTIHYDGKGTFRVYKNKTE